MRPHGCMLKFRLPWDRGSTRYVKGDIHLPVWGPQTTTETRLIVHAKDLDTSIDYDNAAYGERMFFFNTCSRVDFYQHDLPPVAGVDRCYDCAAEAHILTCYLTAIARHDAVIFSDYAKGILHDELVLRVTKLARAAAEAHISVSHLRRLFQIYFRKSPKFVFDNLRFEVASTLLATSTATLDDIASQTGFRSVTDFCRVFKKRYGHPPNEWRRNTTRARAE